MDYTQLQLGVFFAVAKVILEATEELRFLADSERQIHHAMQLISEAVRGHVALALL